jgi:hypothetical protein
LQQFDFVGNLPDFADELLGFLAGGFEAHDVQRAGGDFAHLFLDALQVFLTDGFGEIEIVVEAVFDGGTDAEFRVGIEFQHGLRQQVRRRVAQPIQRAIGIIVQLAHRGQLYRLAQLLQLSAALCVQRVDVANLVAAAIHCHNQVAHGREFMHIVTPVAHIEYAPTSIGCHIPAVLPVLFRQRVDFFDNGREVAAV